MEKCFVLMKRAVRFGCAAALVLVVSFGLASCAKKRAAAGGRGGASGKDTLVVVQREITYTLNPMKVNSPSFLRGVCAGEALFTVDPEGGIHPAIAEKADEVDGGTWNITIRPGVHSPVHFCRRILPCF